MCNIQCPRGEHRSRLVARAVLLAPPLAPLVVWRRAHNLLVGRRDDAAHPRHMIRHWALPNLLVDSPRPDLARGMPHDLWIDLMPKVRVLRASEGWVVALLELEPTLAKLREKANGLQ